MTLPVLRPVSCLCLARCPSGRMCQFATFGHALWLSLSKAGPCVARHPLKKQNDDTYCVLSDNKF